MAAKVACFFLGGGFLTFWSLPSSVFGHLQFLKVVYHNHREALGLGAIALISWLCQDIFFACISYLHCQNFILVQIYSYLHKNNRA